MPLSDEQADKLIDELVTTAEVMGQALSPRAAAQMANDLDDIPLAVSLEALKRVRELPRIPRLTYALIREQLLSMDGRPGREEAWNMALQAVDERDSVVWTREVQMALEAARPALRIKDKVAARLGFLEAYDRHVETARKAMIPVQWSLSAGWDVELRHQALDQAVSFGRLSAQAASLLGYQPNRPPPLTADAKAIIGLLAAPTATSHLMAITNDADTLAALEHDGDKPPPMLKDVTPSLRERLHCLAQSLREGRKIADRERRKRLDDTLNELAERRRQAAAAVEAAQSASRQSQGPIPPC